MSARLRDWLDLEGRLRRALQEDQLHLHYQPKFRLADNQMIGVEALLRWCDAEYGDIPPTRFIEIAEDSGLIIDLGSWVIRAVCRQLREWQDLGIVVPVAINVSGKELLYGDPARADRGRGRRRGRASLADRGRDHRVAPGQGFRPRARQRSSGCGELGCRIALDDFGTGYSSLAYITRFPPDRIKIDKAFVHNLDRSASDAAIANAILSLGESLNVTVTAEGIERPGQLEWLRKRGCHEAQGFLLSRPLPWTHSRADCFSAICLRPTSARRTLCRPTDCADAPASRPDAPPPGRARNRAVTPTARPCEPAPPQCRRSCRATPACPRRMQSRRIRVRHRQR